MGNAAFTLFLLVGTGFLALCMVLLLVCAKVAQ